MFRCTIISFHVGLRILYIWACVWCTCVVVLVYVLLYVKYCVSQPRVPHTSLPIMRCDFLLNTDRFSFSPFALSRTAAAAEAFFPFTFRGIYKWMSILIGQNLHTAHTIHTVTLHTNTMCFFILFFLFAPCSLISKLVLAVANARSAKKNKWKKIMRGKWLKSRFSCDLMSLTASKTVAHTERKRERETNF